MTNMPGDEPPWARPGSKRHAGVRSSSEISPGRPAMWTEMSVFLSACEYKHVSLLSRCTCINARNEGE